MSFGMGEAAGAPSVSVHIERGSTLGHWEVMFHGEAVPGALAVFTGTLALNRLDIASAIVRKTSDGMVRDSFDVTPLNGAGFGPGDAAVLAHMANDGLYGRCDIDARLRAERRLRPAVEQVVAPSVDISTDSELTTGITVRATDRLGLLHDIAATLTRHGMRTRSLTVLTFGGKAHDSFRVVDASGQPPRDEHGLELLRGALVAACAV